MILRERKISYAELAKQMGLTESGVKKIFGSKDCSFARLSQISRILGFKIGDLLDQVENEVMTKVQFSERQQQYLLKNPNLFRLFIKLAIERESVANIKAEFDLSENQLFSMLKKLDHLGMIELHAGSRIKLPKLSLVKDFGEGPLLSHLYQNWGRTIVRELASPKFQASGQFIVRCFKLKEDSYQELLARLLELEGEFLRRAVREMSVSTTHLKTVRWMWLTDQQSFIKGKL